MRKVEKEARKRTGIKGKPLGEPILEQHESYPLAPGLHDALKETANRHETAEDLDRAISEMLDRYADEMPGLLPAGQYERMLEGAARKIRAWNEDA